MVREMLTVKLSPTREVRGEREEYYFEIRIFSSGRLVKRTKVKRVEIDGNTLVPYDAHKERVWWIFFEAEHIVIKMEKLIDENKETSYGLVAYISTRAPSRAPTPSA